jgi:hypothetical protein
LPPLCTIAAASPINVRNRSTVAASELAAASPSSSGHSASISRCSDTVPLLPSAIIALSNASVFFGVLRE